MLKQSIFALTIFSLIPIVSMERQSALQRLNATTAQFAASAQKKREQAEVDAANASGMVDSVEQGLNSLFTELSSVFASDENQPAQSSKPANNNQEAHASLADLLKQIVSKSKEVKQLLAQGDRKNLLIKLYEQRTLVFKAKAKALELRDFAKEAELTKLSGNINKIIDEMGLLGGQSAVVSFSSTSQYDSELLEKVYGDESYRANYVPSVFEADNGINQAKEELARKKLDQLKKKIKCYYQLGKWSAVGLGVTGLAALGAKYGIIPTDKIGVKSYAVAGVVFSIGTGVGIGKNWQLTDEYIRTDASNISQEEASRYIQDKKK